MEALIEFQEKIIIFFYKRIEFSRTYKFLTYAHKKLITNKYLTSFLFVVLLWAIHLLVLAGIVQKFGLVPRSLKGFIGIFTSSFFHGNFNHLASNSIALLMFLPIFVFVRRNNIFTCLLMMILIKGSFYWFLGRNGHLIGASGMAYAIWGYLVLNGILSKDLAKIFLSLALLIPTSFMFKGMSPLHVGPRVAFEGHFFGMLAGFIVAWICYDRSKHSWIDLEPEIPLTFVEVKK